MLFFVSQHDQRLLGPGVIGHVRAAEALDVRLLAVKVMVQVAVDHLRANPAVALGRALKQVMKAVCLQNPAQVISGLAAAALRVLVDRFILPQAASP